MNKIVKALEWQQEDLNLGSLNLKFDVLTATQPNFNCSEAECFPDKSSWHWNEQVCLDVVLCKNVQLPVFYLCQHSEHTGLFTQ